jgi:hypothetical protein
MFHSPSIHKLIPSSCFFTFSASPNYWQSLFEGNLPASLFEQVKKHPEEMEKIKEELIQHELIVDATEQAVLATFRAG